MDGGGVRVRVDCTYSDLVMVDANWLGESSNIHSDRDPSGTAALLKCNNVERSVGEDKYAI